MDGQKKPEPKKTTTPAEWIVIGVIVVLIVLGILLMYLVLFPRLFQGSSTPTPSFPVPKGCPPADTPTGLTASQTNTSKPNVDLSWNPVLVSNTPGNTILGYNIYASTLPGITESNKVLATFTVVPEKRLFATGQSSIKGNTTYYFVVATVDTCATSPISPEISFTTLPT